MTEIVDTEILTTLEESVQTSKWKSYEEYKDSGVEWLGRIPTHWGVIKLKYLTRLKYGNSLPSEKREEGEITVFGSNGPVGTHSQANTSAPVIIIGRKGSFGKVTFSEAPGYAIDTTYYVDATSKSCNLYWLFYVLKLLKLDEFSEDSAIPGLSRDYVYMQQIPDISSQEQESIAAFIIREATRIDQLIVEKERLITLLQEQRTAIVNQAVTKGLNPDVPMKDSGVEWLGEVPEHWEMRKIKYVAEFFGGGTPAKGNINYWNGEIPWVSPKDMKVEVILDTEDHISQDALKESATHLIPPGAALVVVRSGILKHSIPVAINRVSVTLNQDMKAIVPKKLLLVEYLTSLIRSNQNALLVEWRKMGATVESIEHDLLINTQIPIPPLAEQKAIVTSLQLKLPPIDGLISEIQEGIKKVKEYSTALISAAVIGKIDVRGEMAGTDAQDAAD